jgi:hypothetical protein
LIAQAAQVDQKKIEEVEVSTWILAGLVSVLRSAPTLTEQSDSEDPEPLV